MNVAADLCRKNWLINILQSVYGDPAASDRFVFRTKRHGELMTADKVVFYRV